MAFNWSQFKPTNILRNMVYSPPPPPSPTAIRPPTQPTKPAFNVQAFGARLSTPTQSRFTPPPPALTPPPTGGIRPPVNGMQAGTNANYGTIAGTNTPLVAGANGAVQVDPKYKALQDQMAALENQAKSLQTQVTSNNQSEAAAKQAEIERLRPLNQSQAQIEALRTAYLGNLNATDEEVGAEQELTNLIASGRQGALQESGRGVAMPLVTGRQRAILEQSSIAAEPLQTKLARLQSKRQAALDSTSAQLSFEEKRLQAEQKRLDDAAKAEEGFTLGEGQVRYDAQGNPIATGPAKSSEDKRSASYQEFLDAKKEGYAGTFSQYQTEDANRKAKAASQGSDLNALLSVTEAQALGVPYGTTRGQALGQAVTGKPTVEQSKARQFAVAAENANQALSASGYDPGAFELDSLPNVFKGAARQQFEQAARAFVNAVLRRESGATITDDEYRNKYSELIPKEGDQAEVKQQKAAARAAAAQSIAEAGGNYSPDQMQLPGGAIVTRQPDGTYQ